MVETSSIAINEVVYEVQRVYAKDRTAIDLVKDRISEAKGQILPLTVGDDLRYNISAQ